MPFRECFPKNQRLESIKRIKDLSQSKGWAQIRQLAKKKNDAERKKNDENKKKKVRRIIYQHNSNGERSFPYSGTKRSAPKSRKPKKEQSKTGIV